MYGTPRLAELVAGGERADRRLLSSLASFTGDGWEQEDDITLVTLRRTAAARRARRCSSMRSASRAGPATSARRWSASPPPSRRSALEPRRLDRLKTAVAEATMNAIEHGNDSRAGAAGRRRGGRVGGVLTVRITDEGICRADRRPEAPDLDLKLAGLQKPRGWGCS